MKKDSVYLAWKYAIEKHLAKGYKLTDLEWFKLTGCYTGYTTLHLIDKGDKAA